MNKILNNNKGIVLIVCYFVLVTLLGLSAVVFMRTVNENRLAQRSNYSLEAFYAAEAGRAYAYAEASQAGFGWYTHEDRDTPVTSTRTITDTSGQTVAVTYPIPTNMPNASVATTGSYQNCYQVRGKNFAVKSYPERDTLGNFTENIIILSTAEVNGVTRTIELRLGQESAYENFFFFSNSKTFGSVTIDGRNYGAIHVNGDISLTGNPKFYFLTRLSSGSNTAGEGYIYRALHHRFYDCRRNTSYDTRTSDPTDLSTYMYRDTNRHFQTGNTYFRTGTEEDYEQHTLAYYLEGSDASWEFDKYDGNPGDSNDKLPLHYTLDNDDLKNLGIYELCRGEGRVALFDEDKYIEVSNKIKGYEDDVFETLYNKYKNDTTKWDKFWSEWKDNHANDYKSYHNDGTLTGGADWERRFYFAAYNWRDGAGSNPANGIPDRVNREWWEDLSYGDDRSSLFNDMAPAEVVDYYTGKGTDDYFLNTKEQASVWGNWLDAHDLDEAGENQTLVQDRSQGGRYVDPGNIISQQTDYGSIKQQAKNGGIYIGLDGGDFNNPIADCTEERQFYNAQHPARDSKEYKPSNVLVIDVHLLKEKIESAKEACGLDPDNTEECELANFNGIVYIELEDYDWSSHSYDANAEGVMLVNGESLPDGGFSIITPNNVYIKGNYNLDPQGLAEKNRDPDDPQVTQRVIDNKDYIEYESDLEWQAAEIITQRAVYTLSEDFSEPSYIPMAWSHNQQYYEERDYVPEQDFVSGNASYPTDGWVPSPSETRSAKSRVDQWFEYYNGAPKTPSEWTASWINKNWSSNDVFALSNGEYILGRDLRSDVSNHIESKYDSTFNYEVIHGSDGTMNPDTPSQNNRITEKHIYNAAIVSAYTTSPYVLEYWGSTDRVINGAFIQLPNSADYKNPIPNNARYGRVDSPDNFFNYESRFGEGQDEKDRPPAALTFGKVASWRETTSF